MTEQTIDAEVVEEKALAPKAPELPSTQDRLSVDDVIARMKDVQDLMKRVMVDGQDYGLIPGVDKPCLFKPGAEKLGVLFRFSPKFTMEETDLGDGHREVRTTCDLFHVGTGRWVAQAVGSCSTLESKYRWRKASRKCPACGVEAIIKGKEEFGGGWLCWKKKDGCGAKFKEGDESIEGQDVGRIENPDIADQYNTVVKMSQKRAHNSAMLTATGASHLFTIDVDDLPPEQVDSNSAKKKTPPPVSNVTTDSVLNGKVESKTTKRNQRSSSSSSPSHYCGHGVPRDRPCKECEAEIQMDAVTRS